MKRMGEKGTRRVPVLLLGIGGVGRSFLERILRFRSYHADRYGVTLDLVAVADRRGAVIGQDDALGDQAVHDLTSIKKLGLPLSRVPHGYVSRNSLDLVTEFCEPGSVLVDCTASTETEEALVKALELGGRIVLANKKPLAGEYSLYRRLTQNPDRIRWETTVGSSLPVISTLNRIISSGDQISSIVGSFSGTLGLIMTSLQEGRSFGETVKGAHKAGYTEPDPRDDLSGMDVARKTLILARGMGWELELTDVEVESLVADDLKGLSLEEFLDSVGQSDTTFAAKVEACRSCGRELRYVASVKNHQCRVGLVEVEGNSPLGRLRGNDNLVEINTELFSPNPLLIQGRGAGVDATAAGVLSDLLELV